MTNETKHQEPLPWHPGFFAGIQIEFEEEAHKLTFENEHQLGTDPMRIDVLIIKKLTSESIRKNIGRIFREHNLIEYKSPEDYLSIDAFYKVVNTDNLVHAARRFSARFPVIECILSAA